MKLLDIINVGLDKGLMGILNAYVQEQQAMTNPPLDKITRLRLSMRFAPLINVMNTRLMSTLEERDNRPVKSEDVLFKDDAMPFFTMLGNVEKMVANPKNKDYVDISYWVKYHGDVRTSKFLTLERCDKEGKNVMASSTITNLIVLN